MGACSLPEVAVSRRPVRHNMAERRGVCLVVPEQGGRPAKRGLEFEPEPEPESEEVTMGSGRPCRGFREHVADARVRRPEGSGTRRCVFWKLEPLVLSGVLGARSN